MTVKQLKDLGFERLDLNDPALEREIGTGGHIYHIDLPMLNLNIETGVIEKNVPIKFKVFYFNGGGLLYSPDRSELSMEIAYLINAEKELQNLTEAALTTAKTMFS